MKNNADCGWVSFPSAIWVKISSALTSIIARYNSDGNLDSTFGTDGILTLDTDVAPTLFVQADDHILVGYYHTGGYLVRRLSPDGTTDHTFGGTGQIIESNSSHLIALNVAGDGRITAVSSEYVANGCYMRCYSHYLAHVARYNPDGSPDNSFDNGNHIATLAGLLFVNNAAFDGNGRVVVGAAKTSSFNFASPQGLLWSLGTGKGFVSTNKSWWEPSAIALDSEGRTIAVEFYELGWQLRRLTVDGQIDPTFGTVGLVRTNLGIYSQVVDILFRSDDKFLVVGNRRGSEIVLAQYLGANMPTATITSTATPVSFADVATTDYFYEPVQYLVRRGAISGYSCGAVCLEFRPFNNATRGQLAKIVVIAERFEGRISPTHQGPTFSDVPVGSPFFSYVETAAALGIISGYDDGTFRPNAEVTRAQLVKWVSVLSAASV